MSARSIVVLVFAISLVAAVTAYVATRLDAAKPALGNAEAVDTIETDRGEPVAPPVRAEAAAVRETIARPEPLADVAPEHREHVRSLLAARSTGLAALLESPPRLVRCFVLGASKRSVRVRSLDAGERFMAPAGRAVVASLLVSHACREHAPFAVGQVRRLLVQRQLHREIVVHVCGVTETVDLDAARSSLPWAEGRVFVGSPDHSVLRGRVERVDRGSVFDGFLRLGSGEALVSETVRVECVDVVWSAAGWEAGASEVAFNCMRGGGRLVPESSVSFLGPRVEGRTVWLAVRHVSIAELGAFVELTRFVD